MRLRLKLCKNGEDILWQEVTLPVLVGSGEGTDLWIPAAGVADRHMRLACSDRGLVVMACSDAPIALNHEPVSGTALIAEGDEIMFGSMSLTVNVLEDDRAHSGVTQSLGEHRPPMTRPLKLVLLGHAVDASWPIGEDEITLGTGTGNTILLHDPFVSAYHLRIFERDGRVLASDENSTNGSWMNDDRLHVAEIKENDRLRVGQTEFVIAAQDDHARRKRSIKTRLIGSSPEISRLRTNIDRIALTEAPVLITGPTGSGKEVIARMLVEGGPRVDGPLVVLNCGAFARDLIESELFGYEKGAFTGAIGQKEGAFEAASGGTIFLDEIGELPMPLQPHLLRVLETGEVRRVGGTQSIAVDVRIIAATNRRLEIEVAEGRFREDLLHRLHVLTIDAPSLASRGDDIIEIAKAMLAGFAPQGVKLKLSNTARGKLRQHDWPGNVRELRNVIQRAVILRRADVLDADDISFMPRIAKALERVADQPAQAPMNLDDLERHGIQKALEDCNGNRTEAANKLGVSRSTIHRKIETYGLR